MLEGSNIAYRPKTKYTTVELCGLGLWHSATKDRFFFLDLLPSPFLPVPFVVCVWGQGSNLGPHTCMVSVLLLRHPSLFSICYHSFYRDRAIVALGVMGHHTYLAIVLAHTCSMTPLL